MVNDGAKALEENASGGREISRADFERIQPKLIARFRSLGASPEDAHDLAQETFYQACKNLGMFQERAQLDTWIFTISKRVWLKFRRKQKALKRQAEYTSLNTNVDMLKLASPAPGLEEMVMSQDFLDRVGKAIRGLPAAMEQALVMYFNGSKYREIAAHLDISENRVASLIHQARNKLRRDFP